MSIKSIWNSILKFLRLAEHDIEDIVKRFERDVNRLAKRADSHYLAYSEKTQQAERLRLQAKSELQQSERATQIARNISNIFKV